MNTRTERCASGGAVEIDRTHRSEERVVADRAADAQPDRRVRLHRAADVEARGRCRSRPASAAAPRRSRCRSVG